MVGFLTGFFFATWHISHQAVTWIAAYPATQGAALFLLLTLIFFLKYQDEKSRKKYYYLSLGMLLISLGFKEITAFLFIFFPIWGLISIKKEQGWRSSWFKEQISLVICAFLYMGLRALPLLTKVEKHSVVMDKSWNYLSITIYNLVVMPLATISQVFIPDGVIRNLANKLPENFSKSRLFCGSYAVHGIHETFVSIILALLIIAVVVILILYLRRRWEIERANVILFGLVWIGISAMPFAFLGRPFTFLEGRYYYIPAMGAALLLGMVIYCIADGIRRNIAGCRLQHTIFYGLVCLFSIPVFFFHTDKIHRDIKRSIRIGNEQRAILSQIKETFPRIGKKSIFYVEPLMYPTFYCGFGYPLMVIYANEGQLNPCFFKDVSFLWDIEGQGYMEIEGNGFGYFRQYSKLTKAMKRYGLHTEDVYAFRYDMRKKELKDITDDIKNRMKYSGMTAYISGQQPGKRLYLGTPDGHLRSFYSKKFVPTEIKEVKNLSCNEEWFPCDSLAGMTERRWPGTEDYFVTYNYGLESAYGGTYLIYRLAGNGTDVYYIPEELYGFEVAGFSGIRSAVKGCAIMKKIIQKKSGGFDVILSSAYPPSQTVEFEIILNAKVLYYGPGEGINDIVAGRCAEARGDGASKKFIIPLPGILKSLRCFWESNDLRYQPKAFVDGVMTQITSWSGMDTSSLTIEFEKPPAKDALIKVPVLVTYAPKLDDIIKIVNF